LDSLSIIKPDDWHLHLRDGAALRSVVNDSARRFARAIIMPNLKPPVTTCDMALDYRQRVLDALQPGLDFEPLMTLYLTDNTSPDEIVRASQSPYIHAVKLYPAGATTNSDAGVTAIKRVYPVLEAMQRHDLPLLVHGESTAEDIDFFDREKHYIDHTLRPIREDFPELRIVLEHMTTGDAVDFVTAHSAQLTAGTITAHHLLINRNALFKGGINPHHFCLPVAKRETHRQKLLQAATTRSDRFFAGTDSAPHGRSAKESACGCAGIYTAHAAVELYAEAFEQAGDMSGFEQFMSLSGPRFYHLPVNTTRITLKRESWRVQPSIEFASEQLVPFRAGQNVRWSLQDL
jgi:dihydroorotase